MPSQRACQLAHFQLVMTAHDHGEGRRCWNGDPMHSAEASAALWVAVDAFRGALEERGFTVARSSFGVRAGEARERRAREGFEQLVTDLLVALDDWTVLRDGPDVDDAREAVMRELLAFERLRNG